MKSALVSVGPMLMILALTVAAMPAMAAEEPCGANTPVRSTPIRLVEALRCAVEANPQFHSASQAGPIASGRKKQARSAILPKVSAVAFEAHQSLEDFFSGSYQPSGGVIFAEKVTAQRVTLSQPIVDVGSYANARASARTAAAVLFDVEKVRVDLVAQVKRTFYELLLAGELIRVQQATVEQVERQLAQARVNERAGTSARLDVLRAEVQLANVRPQLIQATYDREIARQSLANLLGLDPKTRLEPQGDFLVPAMLPSPDELIARAMAKRPDLAAARERLSAARRTVRSAKAGYLPTLVGSAQYERSRGQRYPLDEEIEVRTATITFNLPIFDGHLTKGRVEESSAQHEKAKSDLEAQLQTARLEILQALALVDQSRAVLDATETAVRQATEALAIAEKGYKLGARTYLEVLDTQLALTTARTNRARARRDYSVALCRLEQAQGLTVGLDDQPKRG